MSHFDVWTLIMDRLYGYLYGCFCFRDFSSRSIFYEIACFSILASASGGPHLWHMRGGVWLLCTLENIFRSSSIYAIIQL